MLTDDTKTKRALQSGRFPVSTAKKAKVMGIFYVFIFYDKVLKANTILSSISRKTENET